MRRCATLSGIIRRAAEHILARVDVLRECLQPGEAVSVRAYGLELYNEELRDLGSNTAAAGGGADSGGGSSSEGVRISERPCGNGRCTPEVRGGGG
jgi:kinesin family protein 4/21/27